MRVISQNGNIDFPYENIAVAHAGERVVVKHDGKDYIVAEYSSNKKSYKAMEMLREAYVGKLVCQNVDLSDDKVVEIMKKWNMGAITVANSDVTRVDYINNTVFQFPKDEEIEVEDE